MESFIPQTCATHNEIQEPGFKESTALEEYITKRKKRNSRLPKDNCKGEKSYIKKSRLYRTFSSESHAFDAPVNIEHEVNHIRTGFISQFSRIHPASRRRGEV